MKLKITINENEISFSITSSSTPDIVICDKHLDGVIAQIFLFLLAAKTINF